MSDCKMCIYIYISNILDIYTKVLLFLFRKYQVSSLGLNHIELIMKIKERKICYRISLYSTLRVDNLILKGFRTYLVSFRRCYTAYISPNKYLIPKCVGIGRWP